MKDRKRRIEFFTFYDRTGIEQHLERMAARGWMLESMSALWWTYRRIEPTALRFAISYYATISDFEPMPTEEQQAYIDFCDHSGWKLVTSSVNMQIFCNGDPDPVPIETDPVLEVENIHRFVKRTTLFSHILMLVIGLTLGASFIDTVLGDPIHLLASAGNMFSGIWAVTAFSYALLDLFGYFFWRRRAKRAAARGEFLPTRGHRRLLIAMVVLLLGSMVVYLLSLADRMFQIYMLGYVISLILCFLAVRGVKQVLKWKHVPERTNKRITWVTSFALAFLLVGAMNAMTMYGIRHEWFGQVKQELPLTVADVLDVDDSTYLKTNGRDASLLLAQVTSSQHERYESDAPRMAYTLTTVKLAPMYDWCEQMLVRRKSGRIAWSGSYQYMETDATPWGAHTAYQMHRDGEPLNEYLLCYAHGFLELTVNWELTAEQMQTIGGIIAEAER